MNNGCCLEIDFNLYGMGLLRLGNVLFRHAVPEAQHVRQGWADSPALVPLEEGIFSTALQVYSATCCSSSLPSLCLPLHNDSHPLPWGRCCLGAVLLHTDAAHALSIGIMTDSTILTYQGLGQRSELPIF